jgi:hypothetical protein
VLDSVLAALPALGPVTVQTRKTCVSLVTPRRVFAVAQIADGHLLDAAGPDHRAQARDRGLVKPRPGILRAAGRRCHRPAPPRHRPARA